MIASCVRSLMTATHGDGSDIQLLLQLTLAYLLTTDKPKTGASEGLQKLTRDEREGLAKFVASLLAVYWNSCDSVTDKKAAERKLAKTLKLLGLPEHFTRCSVRQVTADRNVVQDEVSSNDLIDASQPAEESKTATSSVKIKKQARDRKLKAMTSGSLAHNRSSSKESSSDKENASDSSSRAVELKIKPALTHPATLSSETARMGDDGEEVSDWEQIVAPSSGQGEPVESTL
jgi:hypothetical protein